jgi:hypothetical protein
VTREEILAAVAVERDRQGRKWHGMHDWGRGDCSSSDVPMIVKAGVLAEEAGEVMQAVLNAGPRKAVTDSAIRIETVQTLAVAWAMLEAM